MTILFEKEPYQEECISNILKVLDDSDWRQSPASIKESLTELHKIDSKLKDYSLSRSDDFRLDVMMETGTGKTFTYLKTMYELNKRGIKKFVIFVPRLAIRAGIIQNIKLTSDYFYREYKTRLKSYTYSDKKSMSEVIRYVTDSNQFSVLILTSSSVTEGANGGNGNGRILTRETQILDALISPVDAIGKMRPIIFIDEPHLLKGEGFTNTYRKYFADSLLFRFGATFPTDDKNKLSNVVYVLDSLEAFNECLVKKIAVSTAYDKDTNIKFIKSTEKSKIAAPLTLFYSKSGVEHRAPLNIKENVSSITGDKDHNFHVLGLDGKDVHLSNGTVRKLSTSDYVLSDNIVRTMIQQTLRLHFQKEGGNLKRGIKTLSLFFIPLISDFRGVNPRIKTIFEKEYAKQRKEKLKENISPEYREYLERDYEDGKLIVNQGYFAGDQSSNTNDQNIESGINVILNDKEKLLSTDYPLRFIFSVWALQEGWDNPNVFNICKLATTGEEIKLRQQVGRGLRLAVDIHGRRQTLKYHKKNENIFHDINLLDVVVSGYELNFIDKLQREVVGDKITFSRITEEALIKLGVPDMDAKRFIIFLFEEGIIKESKQPNAYDVCQPVDVFLEKNKESLPDYILENYDKFLEEFKKAKKFDIINRNRDRENYKVGIRQDQFKKFEKLWKTITSMARIHYADVDSNKVIKRVQEEFDKESIFPLERKIRRQRYNYEKNILEEIDQEIVLEPIDYFKEHSYADFVKDFSSSESFPLNFCINLFNKLDRNKISNDPKRAKGIIAALIKESIHELVKDSIEYKFKEGVATAARGAFYEDSRFNAPRKEIDSFKLGDFSPTEDVHPQDFYLYDRLVYDSEIELELLKNHFSGRAANTIEVFAKLPYISIPTPFKEYNPDFAYLVKRKGDSDLFLMIETKGYKKRKDYADEEALKIHYAEKFFEALNEKTDYAHISFEEMLDIGDLPHLLKKYNDK